MYFRNPRHAEISLTLHSGSGLMMGWGGTEHLSLITDINNGQDKWPALAPAADNAVIIDPSPQTPWSLPRASTLMPEIQVQVLQESEFCSMKYQNNWQRLFAFHRFFLPPGLTRDPSSHIHSPVSERCKCPVTARGLITDNHFKKENIRPRIDAEMQNSCCASQTFYRSFANIALLWCQ